jgi:hypothetical protein
MGCRNWGRGSWCHRIPCRSVRRTEVLLHDELALRDSRRDVGLHAVLFRLGLPVAVGAPVAPLTNRNGYVVAALAGGAIWFLLIWPVLWNPSLLPEARRGWIFALIFAFWGAYVALPPAGVALEKFVIAATGEHEIDWAATALQGVFGIALSSVVVGGLNRAARTRLSFAEDEYRDGYDATPQADR